MDHDNQGLSGSSCRRALLANFRLAAAKFFRHAGSDIMRDPTPQVPSQDANGIGIGNSGTKTNQQLPRARSETTLESFFTARPYVDKTTGAIGTSGLGGHLRNHDGEFCGGLANVDEKSLISRESGVALDEAPWEGAFDFVPRMPTEVVNKIFSYVPFDSLLQCQLVSRGWNATSRRNAVWRAMYCDRWTLPACTPNRPSPAGEDWQKIYRMRNALERNWEESRFAATPIEGHKDSVYCTEFDTKEICTGSRDNTLKVWDLKTQRLLYSLEKHHGSVLCISMDENLIVSGSSDCRCLLWDRRRGYRLVGKLEFHTAPILDVALTPKYIIAACKDGRISVWNRRSRSILYYITAHRGPVNAVVAAPDGSTVYSAGGDGSIKQWEIKTGNCLYTFHGHTRGLACVQVSACGRYLVSGSNDRSVRIWDLTTRTSRCLEGHSGVVRSVCVSGHRVLSASYDGMIKIWDLHTGQNLSDLVGLHGSWIFCARANAQYIVSTSVGIRPVMLDYGWNIDMSALKGYI